MPRLSRTVQVHLDKARDSATLAVEIYNKPGTRFRSGGFIVLMCIAWTALLHAVFLRKGEKPYYRSEQSSTDYVMIDGDYKAWELIECAKRYYGSNHDPEFRNMYHLNKAR